MNLKTVNSPVSERTHEFLTRMGWDRSQIEVYVALVRNGPMSRSDLAGELTGSKSANSITLLLKQLEKEGAIEKAGAGHKNDAETFHARHPERVFQRLLDESAEMQKAALGEMTIAYDHAKDIQNRDTEWSVLGTSGVTKVLQDAIDHASKRVLVTGTTIPWCKARHIGKLADRMAGMEVLFVVPNNCSQWVLFGPRNIPCISPEDSPEIHAVVADDEVLIARPDHRGLLRSANPQLVDWVARSIKEKGGKKDGT